MSKKSGEIIQSVVAAFEGADQELFAKGYETAKDPDAFVTIHGAIHPDWAWRATHVMVRLHGSLADWLGERDLLQYKRVQEGDLLSISNPDFVMGSLAAAIEIIARQD